MLQLEDVLVRLWRAEITVRIGTSPPAHIAAVMDVGDSDELWKEFTAAGPPDEIATWLDATARRHFPDRYI